jgi:hypothetical protein
MPTNSRRRAHEVNVDASGWRARPQSQLRPPTMASIRGGQCPDGRTAGPCATRSSVRSGLAVRLVRSSAAWAGQHNLGWDWDQAPPSTQNSLPSGSARITQVTSAGWSSSTEAPSATRRAISCCCGPGGITSRWIRFLPIFGSETLTKYSRTPPSAAGPTLYYSCPGSRSSAWSAHPVTAAQNRATAPGSAQSNVTLRMAETMA